MAGEFGALLDAVRGVRWPARHTVPGVVHGSHHSRLRGISPEFTEYRPYRQGDDPRRIDWKLLGRTDRASIRLSDDRAVLPTMLVVDASASMAFPDGTGSKWTHARAIALALAAISQGQFDPVGMTIAGETGEALRPKARRTAVAEMAALLERTIPAGSAPLAPAIVRIRHALRIAIISDFLGDEVATVRAAREASAAGVELHAVHIVAREEIEPSSNSALVFDPENEAVVRPLAEGTRDAYVSAFSEWRERLADSWRAAGGHYTLVVTDEEPWRSARRIVSSRVGA